ncbi:MAG: hypothetical protein WC455_05225 [Dehalococcoidia bacterium]
MRGASGVLKPFIVVQILVVMLLAGVGTAFAVDPGAAGPNPTPGPSATPVGGGSLTITFYDEVFNLANTQLIGVIVSVHNKDTVLHSGIVNVAVDQDDVTITGNGSVSNLAAGATRQITVDLGPIPSGEADLHTLRVIVTQTQ